jgi:glycosyltransferase involved in cell wall biosynthesis
MAADGHSVKLIAARGESFGADAPLERVPLVDSKHPDVLAVKTELDVGRSPPGFGPLAERIADALRPVLSDVDVLIPHNVCSLNKNLALTAALRQLHQEADSPKFILWHHDLAWTTPRYRSELHAGHPWDLLRTDWPNVTHVTVSETRRGELAALLGIPAGSIVVVPNGVDLDSLLKLEPQTRTLITALGLAEAEPLLLAPVRLTPRKNIELALRILAALRRHLPRAALLVTGPEGPHNPANAEYKRRLLALRDELDLRGAALFAVEHTSAPSAAEGLPDAVIADLFRLADALLLPSREEGFGLPLLEAALARQPIFCADIPPLRELGGGDVVSFSPDGDPISIAATIRDRLAADPIYRFAARVRRGYSWERIYADHIAPLFEKVKPNG